MNAERRPEAAFKSTTKTTTASVTYGPPERQTRRPRFDAKALRRRRKVALELDAILGMHRYRRGEGGRSA